MKESKKGRQPTSLKRILDDYAGVKRKGRPSTVAKKRKAELAVELEEDQERKEQSEVQKIFRAAQERITDPKDLELADALREAQEGIAFAILTRNANAYAKLVEHRAKLKGLLVDKIDLRSQVAFTVMIGGIDPPPIQLPPPMVSIPVPPGVGAKGETPPSPNPVAPLPADVEGADPDDDEDHDPFAGLVDDDDEDHDPFK